MREQEMGRSMSMGVTAVWCVHLCRQHSKDADSSSRLFLIVFELICQKCEEVEPCVSCCLGESRHCSAEPRNCNLTYLYRGGVWTPVCSMVIVSVQDYILGGVLNHEFQLPQGLRSRHTINDQTTLSLWLPMSPNSAVVCLLARLYKNYWIDVHDKFKGLDPTTNWWYNTNTALRAYFPEVLTLIHR